MDENSKRKQIKDKEEANKGQRIRRCNEVS